MKGPSSRGFIRRRIWWVVPVVVLAALLLIFLAHLGVAHYYDAHPEDEVARIAELLRLEPGMTVAEIGAGGGRMTVLMAKHVGHNGKVLSTELNEDRLDDIRAAVREAGLANVTAIKSGKLETHLPSECCDAIFMVKVYHHFTDPAMINRSLFESLRPGGRLAVIDFPPSFWMIWAPRPDGAPENRGGHGMPRELLIKELEQAGFVVEHDIEDWWSWPQRRHCVVVRKPDGA